jgi:hypothetical protein
MMKQVFLLALALTVFVGCDRGNREVEMRDSTIVTRTDDGGSTDIDTPPQPSTQDTQSTSQPVSDLPAVVPPLAPERLETYLPSLDGYTAGEIERETRIRPNLKVSKAWRTYTNGDKKVRVTINDFAYVPSQYTPFEQYRGEYLQDDNLERTEATRLSGYETIQTWLKKENRAELTIFPGKRYVVQVTADGMSSVNEARAIAEKIDLSALESLQ